MPHDDWSRPVGPLVLTHNNFFDSEGHTVSQAGRDPLGCRDDGAIAWDYGNQEEADSDYYRMRDYDPRV